MWEWVLLLLTLRCESRSEEDLGSCELEARYLETERPTFASYSSAWNERLKQEARRAQAAAR
jgi:hypothetical protein